MALKLKVKLSLSKSRYTFVFPAVGAEFDPTTMKQHTWQEMSSQIDIDEPSIEEKRVAKLVKLCLFPALYAYPKTSPEYASRPLEIDMKSQLVDYRNFFVDDGELTTGEPIIVFKALVQL
ncbi:hypothetical protein F5B22DRAFT_136346 [Xylaria bambusicola]|uniref:uncharacterized protein n=1 Tax=Xylaria bambusicola TaxID=326684 RepID=UPI002007CE16|nr:uncharacterized protein F5B22DRAFT_136346 [Xylaria bambusicola]KAI0516891.1 hypothetical protein F5B22DRAFT_136346 [Xylaria bambusicola]